jgi:hypothetical protein
MTMHIRTILIGSVRAPLMAILFFIGLALTKEAVAQSLNWRLAVPKAIQLNAATHTWNSGRVQDSLDFADGRVLVGTNGGGIWWADRDGNAGALSDAWNDPDITAVERGPDSEFHVYVATANGLHENLSAGLDRWQSIEAPADCVIRDIAVMRGARRIILACTNGLFWSDIPQPGAGRVYTWHQATGPGAASDIRSVTVKAVGSAWNALETPTADRLVSNPNVALVSRSPIHRDLFWIGPAGDVRTTWQVRGGTWSEHTFSVTAAAAADPRSSIAAVARGEFHIDVFYVGPAGEVRTTWWDTSNGDWRSHAYTIFGAGTAAIGGSVTAVARTAATLDLFWLTTDGAILHSGWSAGAWSTPKEVVGTGGAAAVTRIAVASRAPELLNVFWIAPTGELKTNWWQQGNANSWRNLYTIPSGGPAARAGGVAAIGRDPEKLDVVWIAADGRLMTTWWNRSSPEQWVGHAYPLTAPHVADVSGNVSLISRNPLHLDLFWQAADGTVRTNYWDQNTSTSFAAQSYGLARGGFRNVLGSSAFDEELTFCTVAMSGQVACTQWMHNDGFVLAGRFGGSSEPLLKGVFTGGTLAVTSARINGGDENYSTTSVAVSKYGTAAYAVAAAPDASVKTIFRSADGGSTWYATPAGVTNESGCTLPTCAGKQGGEWNNTVAVSPVDDRNVYVGWVKLYHSTDGATSWRFISSDHIHADIARVTFGDFDRSGHSVYFSTDGGISATFDGGATYFSRYNERLATLQCYTTDGARQTDGSLTASYQVNDLIGAGLQDNGNVWALQGGAWTRIAGGDGGYMTFVREPQMIQRLTLNDTPFSRFEWDGASLVERGVVTVDRLKPGVPDPPTVLKGGFVIVNAPVAWDAFGARIYGFAWNGNDIYSFWNPTGVKSWRFDFEVSVPLGPGEYFNAGGSANGQVGFFGTSLGRIFSYDRRTAHITPSTIDMSRIPAIGGYGINRLTILSDTEGYALLNCWRSCVRDSGYVLKFDGTRWAPVSGALTTGGVLPLQRYWSLDADWTVTPNTLLLTSDDKVYRSTNSGTTWTEESAGLPRRAHLADIRFVRFPNGTKRFYLATFGRSVWYADVR